MQCLVPVAPRTHEEHQHCQIYRVSPIFVAFVQKYSYPGLVCLLLLVDLLPVLHNEPFKNKLPAYPSLGFQSLLYWKAGILPCVPL
jgi:hypothetical protein